MKEIFNKIHSFPLGIVLLAIALVIQRFAESGPIPNFAEGLLFGLSMVLNLKLIINRSKGKVTGCE